MAQILQIIGITKKEYERLLIENYQQWCEIHAFRSDLLLQKIMLDQKVNKWYITELAKLENTFLKSVNRIADIKFTNHSYMKRQYLETIRTIRTIYPKSLLEKYKPVKTHKQLTFNQN